MTTSLKLVAAALAVILLAGCGGGGGEGKESGEESSSSTNPSGEASAEPADYVDVDGGTELTEPGTVLELGETAVVGFLPKQESAPVVLETTVTAVEQTTFEAAFEGWQVTKQMKKQTPIFVRMTVKNVGETDASKRVVPVTVVDSEEIAVQATYAEGDVFEPCPSGPLPKKLKPGKSADICLLYLLADGREFTSVAFQLVDVPPVTWTGEVSPYAPKGERGKGRKKKSPRDDAEQ